VGHTYSAIFLWAFGFTGMDCGSRGEEGCLGREGPTSKRQRSG